MRDEQTSQSTFPQSTFPQSTSRGNQHLVAELRRFPTIGELRQSQFYNLHEAEIRRLLDEPRVYRCANAQPKLRSFLRVVEWNIERGSHLDGIVRVLTAHPVLMFADLLLVNELDDGMIRSGNLNIALELSNALSAHAVFGVEYLELTKGVGDELALEGENTAALHGNAILTRHPFSNPQLIRLPRCENNFESNDEQTGVSSINPQTFPDLADLADLKDGGTPLSDHDPIVVDIAI